MLEARRDKCPARGVRCVIPRIPRRARRQAPDVDGQIGWAKNGIGRAGIERPVALEAKAIRDIQLASPAIPLLPRGGSAIGDERVGLKLFTPALERERRLNRQPDDARCIHEDSTESLAVLVLPGPADGDRASE